MIARFALIFTFYFLSCACGTSQGPKYIDNPNFSAAGLSSTDKEKLTAEVKAKYD
jgi:hypothetical protein